MFARCDKRDRDTDLDYSTWNCHLAVLCLTAFVTAGDATGSLEADFGVFGLVLTALGTAGCCLLELAAEATLAVDLVLLTVFTLLLTLCTEDDACLAEPNSCICLSCKRDMVSSDAIRTQANSRNVGTAAGISLTSV